LLRPDQKQFKKQGKNVKVNFFIEISWRIFSFQSRIVFIKMPLTALAIQVIKLKLEQQQLD